MPVSNSQAEALCSHLAAHLNRSAPDSIMMSPTRVQHERLGGRNFYTAHFYVEPELGEIDINTTTTPGEDIEVTFLATDPRVYKIAKIALDKWVGHIESVDGNLFRFEVPPVTKTSAPAFRAVGSIAEQLKQMARKHVAAKIKSYEELVNMSKSELDKFVKDQVMLHDGSSFNPLGGESDDVDPLSVIRDGFKVIESSDWYDVVAWKDRQKVAVIYRKKNRHYPSMLYISAPDKYLIDNGKIKSVASTEADFSCPTCGAEPGCNIDCSECLNHSFF